MKYNQEILIDQALRGQIKHLQFIILIYLVNNPWIAQKYSVCACVKSMNSWLHLQEVYK